VTDPAAQRQPTDAGRADDAAGNRPAGLVRGRVDVLPDASAANAGGAGSLVDVDRVDAGKVDDDAVVDDTQPAAVVPAAANGQQRPVIPGEPDHRGHVLWRGAVGDERRVPVDHRVVDGARVVVAGVAGADQFAREAGSQLRAGRIRECCNR
jgi:hypothetical protein